MPLCCKSGGVMKTGDKAILIMKKALKADSRLDEKVYLCKVLRYENKAECIYLVLENDLLSVISLDAIYECRIQEGEETLICTGRMKERFYNEFGKTLQFRIENGFYKISVKSVDK